ncbi:hypothetical protein [Candidatus Thiodictyon syntrophicum]|jgi:bifunctional DNA-binding transcriptional regulator/antitoxin component of YhaV-PrlF toxin-antitoxin module|uniref:SpoVT-AbrB domain-containing protein n=1 Tax=Candidatus Thiodictyon syntrophicum TaxID=1166950 RepID=A0A2K8U7L3_9GAMM|nr:hypothetical protein [Candidatus Thiodictyon syntrophicum]AUB81553.1 hypothetical protein THSYN_11705 [Candidatus Thiodictyon syntrophicum]
MTAPAKITSKGQTTIPQEVRKALQAGPGNVLDHALIRGRPGRLSPADASAVRVGLIQRLDLTSGVNP